MRSFINLPEHEKQFLESTSVAIEAEKKKDLQFDVREEQSRFCELVATTLRSRGLKDLALIPRSLARLARACEETWPSDVAETARRLYKEGLYLLHASLYRVMTQDTPGSEQRVARVRLLSRLETLHRGLITEPSRHASRPSGPELHEEAHNRTTDETFTAPTAVSVTRTTATPDAYIVFRVSGRRYALGVEYVVRVGRITTKDLLSRSVDTPEGTLTLKDIRGLLGISGEAGSVYLAIKAGGRMAAWAVDGIEGLRRAQEFTEKALSSFGSTAPHQLGRILKGILKEAPKAPPIFMLNPGYFALPLK